MIWNILFNMAEMIVANGSITRKPGAFEKRIHEIDFARGILIALVIVDHIFNLLMRYNGTWASTATSNVGMYVAVYKVAAWYWGCAARHVVRYFALFGFCFVSGLSSAFSKNNWVRAGQMLAFYGALTVGSYILQGLLGNSVNATFVIDFNIIGVLAWSTLFYCFTLKKSWRSILIGFLLCFLISSYTIPWLGDTLIANGVDIHAREAMFTNTAGTRYFYAPALFEIKPNGDWLPLFPFMSFFFLGALVSYFVYVPTKKSIIKVRKNWERPICFIGRHTLIIYLAHQVVLLPIFELFGLFLGK